MDDAVTTLLKLSLNDSVSSYLQGGLYIFQLFDYYACSGMTLLLFAILQSVCIGWVYGKENFSLGKICQVVFKPVVPTLRGGETVNRIAKQKNKFMLRKILFMFSHVTLRFASFLYYENHSNEKVQILSLGNLIVDVTYDGSQVDMLHFKGTQLTILNAS